MSRSKCLPRIKLYAHHGEKPYQEKTISINTINGKISRNNIHHRRTENLIEQIPIGNPLISQANNPLILDINLNNNHPDNIQTYQINNSLQPMTSSTTIGSESMKNHQIIVETDNLSPLNEPQILVASMLHDTNEDDSDTTVKMGNDLSSMNQFILDNLEQQDMSTQQATSNQQDISNYPFISFDDTLQPIDDDAVEPLLNFDDGIPEESFNIIPKPSLTNSYQSFSAFLQPIDMELSIYENIMKTSEPSTNNPDQLNFNKKPNIVCNDTDIMFNGNKCNNSKNDWNNIILTSIDYDTNAANNIDFNEPIKLDYEYGVQDSDDEQNNDDILTLSNNLTVLQQNNVSCVQSSSYAQQNMFIENNPLEEHNYVNNTSCNNFNIHNTNTNTNLNLMRAGDKIRKSNIHTKINLEKLIIKQQNPINNDIVLSTPDVTNTILEMESDSIAFINKGTQVTTTTINPEIFKSTLQYHQQQQELQQQELQQQELQQQQQQNNSNNNILQQHQHDQEHHKQQPLIISQKLRKRSDRSRSPLIFKFDESNIDELSITSSICMEPTASTSAALSLKSRRSSYDNPSSVQSVTSTILSDDCFVPSTPGPPIKRRGRPPKPVCTPLSPSAFHGLNPADAKYAEMRNKNNEASRRSRLNRRDREKDAERELIELENKNKMLCLKYESLKRIEAMYKKALMDLVTI